MKTVDFLNMALAKLSITFVIEEAAENYVLKVRILGRERRKENGDARESSDSL